MTKKILLAVAALFALSSCGDVDFQALTNGEGILSFAGFRLETDEDIDVQLKSAVSGDYRITLVDADGHPCLETTYGEILAGPTDIKLQAGTYVLEVLSSAALPTAVFESPVYGASQNVQINAKETTQLGAVTCRLQQCKVTVDYDEELLALVTGPCSCSVEVTAGAPLTYALSYENGVSAYDHRAGYFAVRGDNVTTMTVVFSGQMEGKTQKMKKVFSNVKAAQWRQVHFIKKASTEGNSTIDITVDGYVDDAELSAMIDIPAAPVIGEDPLAPKGDGGITLEYAPDCTMFGGSLDIVVPTMEEGAMDMRLIATVPGGLKKLQVHIDSTSGTFLSAVDTAGGPDLDLVHPSETSAVIFQVVPFPHGDALLGQTSVLFDLSAAQSAILAFPGKHTFTMSLSDQNGCRKEIAVSMTVR